MPSSEELRRAYLRDLGDTVEDERNRMLITRVRQLENRLSDSSWDSLANSIHDVNDEKGFWGDPVVMDKWVAKLMLVVTEIAEVTEALRKSQGKDKVTEEFADVFIRALDIYKVLVDADEADPYLYKILLEKVETNKARPPKHGNRWG